MRRVVAPRASAILYDLLRSHERARTFLLPANICPVVPLTFMKAGVPVEFVDISPDTLSMDLEAARRLLERDPGYGGILYAHTYGDPSTPQAAFASIRAARSDVLIIDDRCLCVPLRQAAPDNTADVILYSTGYAKIAELSWGGYAFIRQTIPFQHHSLSYRVTEWRAADKACKAAIEAGQPFLYEDSDWLETDCELPDWDAYAAQIEETTTQSLEQRRLINAVYDSILPVGLRLPESYQLWRYNIRVKDKRRVLEDIFAAGGFASGHYASLAGIFGPGSGAKSSDLAATVVNLFNDHRYTPQMAEETARIVLRSL